MITLPRGRAAAPPGRPGPAWRPWTSAYWTGLPWIRAILAGLAVLLAGAPVEAVVQGTSWIGYAACAVAAVVLTGLLLHRCAAPVVAVGQCGAVLVLLTVLFTDGGRWGLLPGPAALEALGELINGAGRQISIGIAPVPAGPEILVLLTAAFGLLAVAVHLAAVSAAAPAAAGVPLLAVFAIPAALADDLLPVPMVVAAAAGYGMLLLTGDRTRSRSSGRLAALQRLPGGAALITAALLLAVGIGSGAGFIGTAGRFEGNGGGSAIGLSPFTSLRGQLTDASSVELLRVRGLGQASYVRALTLNEYVSGAGWRAGPPSLGVPLPGPVQPQPVTPGDMVDVQVENVAFQDYWLPLFGEPLVVEGLPAGQWSYDRRSATAYTVRPREEEAWQQRALLLRPTAAALREAGNASGAGPEYRSVLGVDRRVLELARQIVAGRETNFDRAMALQDFFTGPGTGFHYSLQTAPGAGDDPLLEFLTVGRTGYCEQFASAMAVMLRAVGISSRVAVGFTAGTDFGDYRSIRTSDAHAWVEAYFPGSGWVTFDPTPLTDGRTITPEYVLEARGVGVGSPDAGQQPDLGPGRAVDGDAAPAPVPLDEQSAPALAAPTPDGTSASVSWPVAVLVVLAAVALGPAALRTRQRRRRLATVAAGGAPAADAGWRELLAESVDRGVRSPPSDTVRGAARRMVRDHALDPDAQQSLRTVIGAVESSWYGGRHPEADELSRPVAVVHAGIVAGSPMSVRARLLPRSTLTRP